MTQSKEFTAIEESIDFLFSLYERWQDEKEHEDIKEYGKAIEKKLGFEVVMTKRPFGFVFGNHRVKIFVTGREINLTITELKKG